MSMHSFLQHKSLVVDDPIKRNLALCLAARFTWRCHVLSEDTVWCMWQRNNGHPSIDIGAIIVGLYRERVLYRNCRVNEPIELQHRREQRCARRVCVAITLCRVGRFDCHHTICSAALASWRRRKELLSTHGAQRRRARLVRPPRRPPPIPRPPSSERAVPRPARRRMHAELVCAACIRTSSK